MKVLSLKLPEGLDAKLGGKARSRGISKSALVREAIEVLLSHSDVVSPGSFVDLAGDLAGCVAGSEDLSVSQEHFKGYGE